LLKTRNPKVYNVYRELIRYLPQLNLFYNNGIFIKTVEYHDGIIKVKFNDCYQRYGINNSNGKDILFKADIQYLDDGKNIINHIFFSTTIDYSKNESVNLNIDNPYSEMAIVEIYFDNNLMYTNILYFITG